MPTWRSPAFQFERQMKLISVRQRTPWRFPIERTGSDRDGIGVPLAPLTSEKARWLEWVWKRLNSSTLNARETSTSGGENGCTHWNNSPIFIQRERETSLGVIDSCGTYCTRTAIDDERCDGFKHRGMDGLDGRRDSSLCNVISNDPCTFRLTRLVALSAVDVLHHILQSLFAVSTFFLRSTLRTFFSRHHHESVVLQCY